MRVVAALMLVPSFLLAAVVALTSTCDGRPCFLSTELNGSHVTLLVAGVAVLALWLRVTGGLLLAVAGIYYVYVLLIHTQLPFLAFLPALFTIGGLANAWDAFQSRRGRTGS